MKWRIVLVRVPLILLSMSAFAQSSGDKTQWRAQMVELSQALSDATPLLYAESKNNMKELTEKVKKIYDITLKLDTGLNHKMVVPDADPALPYIASLFRSDIQQAYESLQEGHAGYARNMIRSSVAYCIACHTRMQTGVQFPFLKAFDKQLAKASWIEKIEFQAASRQFDPAFAEVKTQLLRRDQSLANPLEMERASHIALSIAVRVKKDPGMASSLAKLISTSPSASVFMKSGATQWLKDIEEWRKEQKRVYANDKILLDSAKALMVGGEGPHGEVRLLRASVLMHDLLSRFPNSKYTAEALYTIGRSYASLRDLGLWSLHEMYFKACVEKVPHTPLAANCYQEYEQSVVAGYSGSSGTHLPGSVSRGLAKLKTLSAPLSPLSK